MDYWSSSVESKEAGHSVRSMAVEFYCKSSLENSKVEGILWKNMCAYVCSMYMCIVHVCVYVILHERVHMYEWVHVCT